MISKLPIRVPLLVCLLGCLTSSAALARPARPAPPLPAPSGTVVNVSTEPQLQAAMQALTSNTTIVLAPGTYVLTRTLYIHGVFNNVGIRGATGNADDVVIVGPGMTQASYGEAPFGIWTGDGVTGVTIANLTIRDFYFHPIIFNGGTQSPRVYNVHLINAGEQFIKVNPDASGAGASNGILEYSVIEFVTTARNDYPKGIDIQGATNWTIRHNLFRNLVAPPGQILGPGILVWRGSSNTLVEGNTFLNCARGVMFGADDTVSPSHSGGIIRNNMFHRSASQAGDVGIILSDSPRTQVLNNTLIVSGTYGTPLEIRYAGTKDGLVANNLLDGTIGLRDGGTATQSHNYVGAVSTMFVDAASGDLHLSASATGAIDRGDTLAAVTDDWDGELRPKGNAYDIGADERGAAAVGYQIAGRITTSSDGAALPGVAVALGGARTASTTTDASGRYAFTGLAPDADYEVTPTKSGYLFTPSRRFFALGADQIGADFTATAATPPSGGATATFVKLDTTTQGSWRGVYGADGYALANVGASYPAYAQVAIAGASTWTWNGSTADVRALVRPAGVDRVAACWYSGASFTVDVNLTDGAAHTIALYAVDWESNTRVDRIDVLDASSGAVLDSRSLSAFNRGQYAVWTIAGHVVLRVTSTGAINGVVSGIFFDRAGAAPPPPPPSGTTAAFVKGDTTTQGSWRGVYGADGYALANVGTSYPAYAQVAVNGSATYTWNGSTSDVRALQRPAGTDRIAACWYSGASFAVDVNLTDGAAHTIALYALDWDSNARAERIDVLDAASGALLDSRTLAGFRGGQYAVWTVSGHVIFRVTSTGAINAVVSGIFFDR
jgi:hypothetical protein